MVWTGSHLIIVLVLVLVLVLEKLVIAQKGVSPRSEVRGHSGTPGANIRSRTRTITKVAASPA
jgi:hypothetical protein